MYRLRLPAVSSSGLYSTSKSSAISPDPTCSLFSSLLLQVSETAVSLSTSTDVKLRPRLPLLALMPRVVPLRSAKIKTFASVSLLIPCRPIFSRKTLRIRDGRTSPPPKKPTMFLDRNKSVYQHRLGAGSTGQYRNFQPLWFVREWRDFGEEYLFTLARVRTWDLWI